jgi:hypothetical protein
MLQEMPGHLAEIRGQLANLEERVVALQKDSDQLRAYETNLHTVGSDPTAPIGIAELLPRIDLLATKVADLERRTGGRLLSQAEVVIQQHAALKYQLGEGGSFSDAPNGQ